MAIKKTSKEEILKESIKLFKIRGYSNTSMANIAEACGLIKGSIYHHFKSKDEIGLESLKYIHDYFDKEIFSIDFSEYKNIISEIAATKSELKRIGNNINQIAKHLNENKNNQTKEWMSDYQKQLENLEDKIQKVIHFISEGEKK